MNLNTRNTHDLTDNELTVGSFVLAISFMWSCRQLPEWPQFFQQQSFPSVPSLANFYRAIIFRRFHIDFLRANLATPIILYRLFSNIRCARRWSKLEIAVLHPRQTVSIVQSSYWYRHTVSWPGLFRTPHCHTSPTALDAKQTQEANVLTRNSSLCWQFGEIVALEPFVPPKSNWRTAAIYSSGQTGIRFYRFHEFASRDVYQVSYHSTTGPHRQCLKRSTLFHSVTYLKASEFLIAHWEEACWSVGFPWIRFLLSVKYVHSFNRIPPQRTGSFPLSLARWCCHVASNRQLNNSLSGSTSEL